MNSAKDAAKNLPRDAFRVLYFFRREKLGVGRRRATPGRVVKGVGDVA